MKILQLVKLDRECKACCITSNAFFFQYFHTGRFEKSGTNVAKYHTGDDRPIGSTTLRLPLAAKEEAEQMHLFHATTELVKGI